jgi:hypothetical protein
MAGPPQEADRFYELFLLAETLRRFVAGRPKPEKTIGFMQLKCKSRLQTMLNRMKCMYWLTNGRRFFGLKVGLRLT